MKPGSLQHLGYFFSTSNSGKRSASLNLRAAEDRERFLALVAEADVLVENMKPGSLNISAWAWRRSRASIRA